MDRTSVHTRFIISVIDGRLSLYTVDNLLWDSGLSEQDEHQPIYCIWIDKSVFSNAGAQTVTDGSG